MGVGDLVMLAVGDVTVQGHASAGDPQRAHCAGLGGCKRRAIGAGGNGEAAAAVQGMLVAQDEKGCVGHGDRCSSSEPQ